MVITVISYSVTIQEKNGNVTSALSVCIINWFQHYWGPMCKSYHTHWSLSTPFLLCVCLNLSQCQSFSCWLTFPDPVNWLVNSEYARICGKHTKTANVWRLYINFPIFVAFRIKKKTGLIVFRSFPEYHAMGHMLRLDMVSSNWASWFVILSSFSSDTESSPLLSIEKWPLCL